MKKIKHVFLTKEKEVDLVFKPTPYNLRTEKRKCAGCKKLKVMQPRTTRCRQCFENKNIIKK